MNVEITQIRDTEIVIKDTKTNCEYVMPLDKFDIFMIRVGTTFETVNNSVPYGISRARRLDIREHHAEEARCGNI